MYNVGQLLVLAFISRCQYCWGNGLWEEEEEEERCENDYPARQAGGAHSTDIIRLLHPKLRTLCSKKDQIPMLVCIQPFLMPVEYSVTLLFYSSWGLRGILSTKGFCKWLMSEFCIVVCSTGLFSRSKVNYLDDHPVPFPICFPSCSVFHLALEWVPNVLQHCSLLSCFWLHWVKLQCSVRKWSISIRVMENSLKNNNRCFSSWTKKIQVVWQERFNLFVYSLSY